MAGVVEALGAVSLATLFSTCVQCFGYLRASKRMEKDIDILLVRLDIEKIRLLVWGDSVGVLDASVRQQGSPIRNGERIELLFKSLKSIEGSFNRCRELVKTYGLTKDVEDNGRRIEFLSYGSMILFKKAVRRFWIRNPACVPEHSLLPKIKWAIYKKESFQGFVNDLKDLIDGLYEVASISRDPLDKRVTGEIESLTDIDQLRLIEAATEDSYRAWSSVASSVIEASETGTLDLRVVEEQLVDETPIYKVSRRQLSDGIAPLEWDASSGTLF